LEAVMKKSYDVVIVGGGILGCSVAYHLCTQSRLKVALVERGMIGMQTTSLAASVITRGKSTQAQIDLVRDTYNAIDTLETKLGEDLNFNSVGSLHIAQSDRSAEAFAKQAKLLREVGDTPQELSVEQAKEMVPWLALDEATLVSYNPLDGFVDPYRLTSAYIRGAKASGRLDVYQSTEVFELEAKDGLVTGVETKSGYLQSDQVVIAAGPWANRLLKPHGSSAAMAPVRSHYWMTESHSAFPVTSPVVLLPEANAYARPEVGGLLFGLRNQIGKWAHPEELPTSLQGFSFDEDFHGWQALEEAAGLFLDLCPALSEAEIHHYISGPSCYTPDSNYLIGATPNLRGAYLASGCCGSGIAISGGVGSSIADLVLGRSPKIDLTAFAPNRFTDFDPYDREFLEQCVQSRSLKKAG
jgi:sarcosine oxidase subunit beta